jgi:transposase
MELDWKALESAERSELIEIIKQQAGFIKELSARVAALEEEVRKAQRQASPFSKGRGKPNPKKPGRRAGQGSFVNRRQPEGGPSDQVEQIEVPLAQKQCPQCQVPLEVQTETATVEDVPPKPVRHITIYRVEVGRCPICGRKIRGRHPDLPEDQQGATAHRLGCGVMGQALALHYHGGLPQRKVPQVIAMTTGIALTQSAITQRAGALCARQGPVGKAYQSLREEIASSETVNTDDTGWRTGGQPSFLMGFFTKLTAVYQVRDQHRHEEVLEVLGLDFKGKLGTDRGKTYDATVFENIEQQKCLSHLLKNASVVQASKTGRARCFTRDLQKTLRAGLELWQEYTKGKLSRKEYDHRGEELEQKLTYQLRDRVLSDADNQRLLNGIGWQHDRGRIFLFLRHPEIEPTNNRAERGLRPAVIARKVSQCSKNKQGARIFEAMKSVATTLCFRGQCAAAGLADLIQGRPMPN